MKCVSWVCACAVVALAMVSLSTAALAQSGGRAAAGKESDSQAIVRPAAAAEAGSDCLCIGQDSSSSAERIKETLRGPLNSNNLQFQETPLNVVVAAIQEEYNIPIEIDVPALDDVGLSPQEPVSVSLRNVSLRSALRLMLNRLHLTYVIRDEVLLITTPEETETYLITCVYDVRDLIQGERDQRGMEAIITAISSCVAPDTWNSNEGGDANIRPLRPGMLVVLQTPGIHEQISELLASIRQLRGTAVADSARDSSRGRAITVGGHGFGFGGSGVFIDEEGTSGRNDAADPPFPVAR